MRVFPEHMIDNAPRRFYCSCVVRLFPSPLFNGVRTSMADKKAATDGKAKSINKSELLEQIATATALTKKQVAAVFAELTNVVKKQVGKKGPGVLNIFGLVKVYRVSKPATKATTKANPFK